MLSPNIFKKDDDYLELLDSNVWLMDNHKWALYVWESNRLKDGLYTLVHVDYHWDAVYDFWDNPEKEKALLESSLDELKSLIKDESLIQYDSFIGPALARGLIGDIHFLCFQEDCDEGFWQPVLDRFGCKQTIHGDSKSLNAVNIDSPLLFDFCLDVFNCSDYEYRSELWKDEEIEKLLIDCKMLVQMADIVTISMSYGYSGTLEDTKALTERIVPLFVDWRNAS